MTTASTESFELTAVTPLDGRYATKVSALTGIFSEYGLIHRRLLIEVRWLLALARHPDIEEVSELSSGAEEALLAVTDRFSVADATKVKAIEATTNHDVKAVEYFLKEQLLTHEELAAISEFAHFACTSEDINNLAHGMMLKDGLQQALLPALRAIESSLLDLAHEHANTAMLSRTHGQTASPTTLGKELANVVARLKRQVARIEAVPLYGKMNGAVGNYNAHFVAYPD
ncbi:MAG: lyase family protein, partial [Pseudomonadota bacterium]